MKSKHTDEQLSWLRSHLAEYETRAGGNVRGDAKKFALEKAVKYIEKWGVPDGEKETTMKEVRLQTIKEADLALHGLSSKFTPGSKIHQPEARKRGKGISS